MGARMCTRQTFKDNDSRVKCGINCFIIRDVGRANIDKLDDGGKKKVKKKFDDDVVENVDDDVVENVDDDVNDDVDVAK